jgi:DNA topoisomerase-1
VKHGGINATVPRDIKLEDLTIDQASSLLAERATKNGGNGGKKAKTPRAKKAAPAPANDAGEKPAPKKKTAAAKKKSAAKRKTKPETPPRTGTDG